MQKPNAWIKPVVLLLLLGLTGMAFLFLLSNYPLHRVWLLFVPLLLCVWVVIREGLVKSSRLTSHKAILLALSLVAGLTAAYVVLDWIDYRHVWQYTQFAYKVESGACCTNCTIIGQLRPNTIVVHYSFEDPKTMQSVDTVPHFEGQCVLSGAEREQCLDMLRRTTFKAKKLVTPAVFGYTWLTVSFINDRGETTLRGKVNNEQDWSRFESQVRSKAGIPGPGAFAFQDLR